MPFILALLSQYRVQLAIGLAVLAVVLFVYFKGRHDYAEKASAAADKANVQVLKADGTAKEKASDQRRADDARIVAQEKGLNDAVSKLPDGVPSARRRALACERLRRQGTRTDRISACN